MGKVAPESRVTGRSTAGMGTGAREGPAVGWNLGAPTPRPAPKGRQNGLRTS